MSDMYLGLIVFAGFSFTARGFATCQGQQIAITQNTALFSLLGTTYGGNGQTTFALPNAGGRTLLGQGRAPGVANQYVMGEVAGSETVTLNSSQMPMHAHTVTANVPMQAISGVGAASQTDTPEDGARLGTIIDSGGTGSPVLYVPAGTAGTAVNLAGGQLNTSTTVAGGSQPFSILQPFLVVNALIVVEGIFPSRN